jgi:Domain of unknown function (DUF4386)
MNTDEQLLAESRERPRIAIVAALAGLLPLVGAAIPLLGSTSVPQNGPDLMIFIHDHAVTFAASAILVALGTIGIAIVLDFVYRITRARNPDLPPVSRYTAVVGGLIAAVAGVVFQLAYSAEASHFATHGSQTYDEMQHILKSSGFLVPQYVGFASHLALGFAFVLLSLNAMRVGLLPRAMGYIGIASGVLFVIPLVRAPIVQAFWLFALAYLLSGRWPNGVPPSWRTGKAEPWPSAAALREQRGAGGSGGAVAVEPAGAAAVAVGDGQGTARRKRKKRR